MNTLRPCKLPSRLPRRQSGAVLYVALVMLILLALIGIVGMQVAGLQERMAANYRNANLAFQNAEAVAREMERKIDAALTGEAGTYEADQEVCQPNFDPVTWADGISATKATYTRRIDQCFPASSRVAGKKRNEQTSNIYEVNSLASDNAASATSSAVISTIYIP